MSRGYGVSIRRSWRSRSRAGPLLSPFDRLTMTAGARSDLFEFDYQPRMYKPAGKRRWGVFALPIRREPAGGQARRHR